MVAKMQSAHGQKSPSLPGIYFFRNIKGEILYIGKAANLKARLGSYFQKNQQSLKTKALLKEASSISWNTLSSETEALIKESELIKKYQPKYNVLMRDDKQYFYVGFTKEKYPRVFLTHQTPRGPRYIGPFTDGIAIKSVLKILRHVFPYCTCKKPHKTLCLNARIGGCLGFCCNSSPKLPPLIVRGGGEGEELIIYRKNIKAIKSVLSGKNKSLIKNLKKEMKKLSAERLFEKAALARDQIRALTKIFVHKEIISRDLISENIKAISTLESILKIKDISRIEGYDIANIQGKYAYGSLAVFINGFPAKDLYRIFSVKNGSAFGGKIKSVLGANDPAMLKEVIVRRLKHKEWQYPDVILVDGGKQQLNASLDALRSILDAKIIALTKDSRHRGHHIYISGQKQPLLLNALPSPLRNLLLHIDSEAHRFAIKYYRKSHRKILKN